MTDEVVTPPTPRPPKAQVSSSSTMMAGVSATAIAPLIEWALNGCPKPIPAAVPIIIATIIMALVHALYNVAKTKQGGTK